MYQIPANESCCLLPLGIIKAVEAFCDRDDGNFGRVSLYKLNCLSMILEAVILYDKVFTYDYLHFYDLYEDHVDSPLYKSPVLIELNRDNKPFVKIIDLYKNMSIDERIKINKKFISSYFDIYGGVISTSIAGKINEAKRSFTNSEFSEIKKIVKSSFLTYEEPEFFENIHPNERNIFISNYMSTQLWHIDQLRLLSSELKTSGSFFLPQWEPIWQHERRMVISALHEKFIQAEGTMIETHLSGFSKIDVSPLVIIALDQTKTPEELPEIIHKMRNEYSELRYESSKFLKMLDESENYFEAKSIIKEWSIKWEIIIDRIKTHSDTIPLIRKLFAWDIVKDLSARSLFLNSVKIVFTEMKNFIISKKLSIIGRLEKDFLRSKRIEKNLVRLYGSEYLSSKPFLEKRIDVFVEKFHVMNKKKGNQII